MISDSAWKTAKRLREKTNKEKKWQIKSICRTRRLCHKKNGTLHKRISDTFLLPLPPSKAKRKLVGNLCNYYFFFSNFSYFPLSLGWHFLIGSTKEEKKQKWLWERKKKTKKKRWLKTSEEETKKKLERDFFLLFFFLFQMRGKQFDFANRQFTPIVLASRQMAFDCCTHWKELF